MRAPSPVPGGSSSPARRRRPRKRRSRPSSATASLAMPSSAGVPPSTTPLRATSPYPDRRFPVPSEPSGHSGLSSPSDRFAAHLGTRRSSAVLREKVLAKERELFASTVDKLMSDP